MISGIEYEVVRDRALGELEYLTAMDDEAKEAMKALVETMAKVYKRDPVFNNMVTTTASAAVFGLLAPLEEKDFKEDGTCPRALTCFKRDGKYYCDVGRVFVNDTQVDLKRPQAVVEITLPCIPKVKVYRLKAPCEDCCKDGTECDSCSNVEQE